jgi:hypothetical protein
VRWDLRWCCTVGRLSQSFLPGRSVAVGIEGAEAAASPSGDDVVGIVTGIFGATELVGEVQEGPEEGGAVVIHQFDQAGLLDEAAEFDEVAGTLAACLGPIAHVGASLLSVQPMSLDCCSLQQACRRLQVPEQGHQPRSAFPGRPVWCRRERTRCRDRSTSRPLRAFP